MLWDAVGGPFVSSDFLMVFVCIVKSLFLRSQPCLQEVFKRFSQLMLEVFGKVGRTVISWIYLFFEQYSFSAPLINVSPKNCEDVSSTVKKKKKALTVFY